MASEGLSGLTTADVPELGARVAGAGDECVHVGGERKAVQNKHELNACHR
jgi:hypothetical protein